MAINNNNYFKSIFFRFAFSPLQTDGIVLKSLNDLLATALMRRNHIQTHYIQLIRRIE